MTRRLLPLCWGVLAPLALSCGTTASAPRAPTASAPSVPRGPSDLYLAALEDAAIPEPNEIAELWALSRANSNLEWESDQASARVKVATLLNEDAYQRFYSEDPPDRAAPPAWGIIWVTPVPQLRTFCSSIQGEGQALVERVKQYLGLRPSATYTRVVEIWVRPSDLARPCPDPEVTDARCALNVANPPPEPEYNEWFAMNYIKSYQAEGFPWTRLGYTYDWAPPSDPLNPRKPIGASEYILRPGVPYTIAARNTLEQYCQ